MTCRNPFKRIGCIKEYQGYEVFEKVSNEDLVMNEIESIGEVDQYSNESSYSSDLDDFIVLDDDDNLI